MCVVFALLPNKKQQTSHRLIDELSEICPSWESEIYSDGFSEIC